MINETPQSRATKDPQGFDEFRHSYARGYLSGDDDASEFHDDLFEHDSYLASCLASLMRKPDPKLGEEMVMRTSEMRRRLDQLIEKHGERPDLEFFRDYFSLVQDWSTELSDCFESQSSEARSGYYPLSFLKSSVQGMTIVNEAGFREV